jgi:hypothetical protein
MPYDVLRDDLYDQNSRNQNNSGSSGSFLIHLLLIILILFVIGSIVYFFWPEDLFGTNSEEESVTFLGQLKEFNESYEGDLNVTSSQFTLLIPSGRFDDSSKTLSIENFSGRIYLFNNSVHYDGVAKRIKYAGNTINLEGDSFTLDSRRKTKTQLFYEDLELNFESGRLKLNNELNFEFTDTKVELKNYNVSLSYDGSFSFSGIAEHFTLDAPNEFLSLSYTYNESQKKKK